jgi:L-alanine-DL-glutamate epimerase-like enolase superfamily enzyme
MAQSRSCNADEGVNTVRIVELETVRTPLHPNLLFLLLRTDDGLVGLGEAFNGAAAVEAYLHETVADALFALPDVSPELCARSLTPYLGFQGSGAETRGNGAVDFALWDLLGKAAGLPLTRLLGGPVRTPMPVYNTCAGSGYIRDAARQSSDNWGLPTEQVPATENLEDLAGFLHRPRELARSLWDEGIRGMKIWPFDLEAERTNGTDISVGALGEAIGIVEAIREEVGLEMSLMIELHGLWNRPAAEKIMNALVPYQPYWVEDPLRSDAADAMARLAASVDLPIATGETCVGRRGFRPLLESGAVDVATMDLQWTGGLTEARKIATMADAYAIPIAPHDCTGPVTLACSAHLLAGQPNGLVQETVRAFLRTWYRDLVVGVPVVEDGHISLGDEPGHGVGLRDDLPPDAWLRRLKRRPSPTFV